MFVFISFLSARDLLKETSNLGGRTFAVRNLLGTVLIFEGCRGGAAGLDAPSHHHIQYFA
jgi:hypothetical protein